MFMYSRWGGNSYNDLFIMVRMPLFFFVSGFLLDKPGVVWGVKDIVPFIKKKAKIQLVPTLFFMLVYCYLFDREIMSSLEDGMKAGYWFTITLFEFFLVYSLCKMMPLRFQYKALFVLSLMFLLMGRLQVKFNFSFWDPLQFCHLHYFVYFSFGAFVKSRFSSFTAFLEGKWFPLVLLAFFGIAFLEIKSSFVSELHGARFIFAFLGMAGICIIFNFFRKYEASFRQTTVLGRSLQYIGKRTLDVYLLHYFFLPRHLVMVGDFFKTNFNPSVEFVFSFLLALVVVGLSLVMSNIIRTSDILAHWLFGVKRQA